MILRAASTAVERSLDEFPVVGLVGPRQVGKTTLARELVRNRSGPTVFLDLERPSDLAKLGDAEGYLTRHAGSLIVLDEVQRRPDLFPLLRALVDDDRRSGRFLILGSASPELTQGTSESLAGRIIYHELVPFSVLEVAKRDWDALWSRGGFPDSFTARSDEASMRWREAFIQTHLERDLPSLGLKIPAAQLRRFWQMLAHQHGQLWNGSALASSLGVSHPTTRRYLDVLQDTYMIRQLQPYSANVGKRLVKSPKVYLRDAGLLHALLGIPTRDALDGHPVRGASWEGWVIEQILAIAPPQWRAFFYRTAAGAEVDLVLERPGGARPLALEIKAGAAPVPTKGFWSALEDLDAIGMVICQAKERYPLRAGVDAVPVTDLAGALRMPTPTW
jgi:uncharacterized protein